MKLRLRLLIALLLLGTSIASAQSSVDSDAKPLHISSRGTSFGVQGEFEGTYRIYDSSIEVDISKATIYVSEHCPYQGRRSINFMRVNLGVDTPPESKWVWKPESKSQEIPLNLIMSPKEENSFFNLHFSIPKDRETDLSKRWFVVEIQTDAIDAPPIKGRGYVFAFSCKDIFTKQGSDTLSQCSSPVKPKKTPPNPEPISQINE